MLTGEIVDIGDHREAAGIDLGYAGYTVRVRLEVKTENSRGVLVDGADGGRAHVDHAWLKKRFGDRRGG